MSEIRSTVACQKKYSGNICHARNRGPSQFLTSKRRKRKKEKRSKKKYNYVLPDK
jgi:hypothetical protein